MNPFYMMNILQQVREIKQNPNQLASLLQQKGMINNQQAYLMQNGKMPTNVQQYQGQVNQVQNMMNDNKI